MIIFFAYTGTDEIHSLPIGRFGGSWNALSSPYRGVVFGCIPNRTSRAVLDEISPHLTVMPGPNGLLSADQATAIAPAFPTAKAGDAWREYLSTLFADTQMPLLDPEAY